MHRGFLVAQSCRRGGRVNDSREAWYSERVSETPSELLFTRLRGVVSSHFEAAQVPLLTRLVEQPSYTSDREDVERAACIVDEVATHLGLSVTRWSDPDGKYADHRVYSTPACGANDRALALVGHVDTVFPRSLGFERFTREEDIAKGPGVLDMKSGITAVLFGLHAVREAAPELWNRLRARFVCVSDEEVGSPSSRTLFESLSERTNAALVFEAGRFQDRIVTQRRGGGLWTIHAHGRAAHAGNHHAQGISAIHALSLLVPKLEAITDYTRGLTVSVGLFHGGTAKNTVPEHASLQLDARFERAADAAELELALERLVAEPYAGLLGVPEKLHSVRFVLEGGITRPPMEASDASQELRRRYEADAARCGLSVGEAPLQGGGSDANLLSGWGVPCIDGLGPWGEHFHQTAEYCSLSSLRMRTEALACFLANEALCATC
jgi:glutamate carboxypeptidase